MKVTTNVPIYINDVLHCQFVHRKISTLTFGTNHVYVTKFIFMQKENLPVNSVIEMRCHVLQSVIATVQEESVACILGVDGCDTV